MAHAAAAADSLRITGDRLGGALEERQAVPIDDGPDHGAAVAVPVAEVVDDDDDASDDGDVEAAFAAHQQKPARPQNRPQRPVSAIVQQSADRRDDPAMSGTTAGRARPLTAAVTRHKHGPADDDAYDDLLLDSEATAEEERRARRGATTAAARKRQTGRLSADHIEKLSAMLRSAVDATGTNCGLLNAAHNPLGLSRPSSAAATTKTRPTSAAGAAAAGTGRAAARASRPGTAHRSSRPTSAAPAAASSVAGGTRPASATSSASTATRRHTRPQSATSSVRHHDFQSSVQSASGAAAAFDQPTSSFVQLERRYFDGVASSKHETLRRAKLTSRSLYRRYAGGVRLEDDAVVAESESDGAVGGNADGAAASGGGAAFSAAAAAGEPTTAAENPPTSVVVGRPPSGARSRPVTASASRAPAPHRPLSGSSRSTSQRRPLSASTSAATRTTHVDIDPSATLGTAQVLAVRAEDEAWALGRSASSTRGSSFFDTHDTAPGITNYLRQEKRARVTPFAVGAEKSATTRAQQASRRDRIERDRRAAASYIADYVSALGPLHLEP